MHRLFRLAVPIACVLGLAGCVTSQTAFKAAPPSLPAPLYEPLPLKVGIWYGDLVRAHRAQGVAQGRRQNGSEYAVSYDVDFGDTHLAVLQRTFAATFAETVTLTARPAGPAGDPGLDLLLLADVHWVQFGPETEVKYRLTFRRPDGSDLADYTAKGSAGEATPADRRMAAALRDAAAQIMVRLAQNDALAEIARSRGRAPAGGGSVAAPSGVPAPGFVVVPERLDMRIDERSADCIADTIDGKVPGLSPLPAATLRDALFPWLEPGTKPYHDADVLDLVRRPLIAARMRSLGARYLVLAGGGLMGEPLPDTCVSLTCFAAHAILNPSTLYGAALLDIGQAPSAPQTIGRYEERGSCSAVGRMVAAAIETAAKR